MTLQPASGARDLNPQQVRKNHLIASKLSSLYQLWGYERISPPHIERLDTLTAAGGISNNEILKIVSDEPLGLRPEITASIVRAASTRFNEYEKPLRFWSTGTSFKCNQSIDGGIDITDQCQKLYREWMNSLNSDHKLEVFDLNYGNKFYPALMLKGYKEY